MNILLLLDADRVAAGRFRVGGARARHVREVLGLCVGDRLRAGLLDGPVGRAKIVAVGEAEIVLDVDLAGPPPAPSGVDLVLAMPRPKMLRRLLPQIAAMGIDSLVLLRTWRVAKPYLSAHILQPAVYRPLLHEGLMQGRSTREPQVRVESLFRPYVEDRVAQEFAGARCIVAHPAAPTPLDAAGLHGTARVALAIGPEGGLLPFEVELLAAAGFLPVTMGERTLRVDTAAVALLAQIDVLRRRGAAAE